MKHQTHSKSISGFRRVNHKGLISPCLIGLTGGLSAGKSLALNIIKSKGIPTLQTDTIGHDCLKNDKTINQITKRLGKGILDSRHGIDRQKLAKLVFNHPSKLRILNHLLHPLIMKKVERWLAELTTNKKKPFTAVVEIPLLFECGYERIFDGVLSVSASKITRHKRFNAKKSTMGDITKREKSQWAQNRKNNKANWVIFNNGSRNALKYSILEWLRTIRSLAEQQFPYGVFTARKYFGKK